MPAHRGSSRRPKCLSGRLPSALPGRKTPQNASLTGEYPVGLRKHPSSAETWRARYTCHQSSRLCPRPPCESLTARAESPYAGIAWCDVPFSPGTTRTSVGSCTRSALGVEPRGRRGVAASGRDAVGAHAESMAPAAARAVRAARAAGRPIRTSSATCRRSRNRARGIAPRHPGARRARPNLPRVAYFSMEFGLHEALPLYAGGLGVLAGDYLKTASDLDVPVVGVGILWQQGYFRQVLDAGGRQTELYPFNEPASLPVQPVVSALGERLRISLDVSGPNDSAASVAGDGRPHGAVPARQQRPVQRSGGPWPDERALRRKLRGPPAAGDHPRRRRMAARSKRSTSRSRVCHLNEGHAAFVVVERARRFMEQHRVDLSRSVVGDARRERVHDPYGGAGWVRHVRGRRHPEASTLLRRVRSQLGLSWPELLALGRRESRRRGRTVQHGLAGHARVFVGQWRQPAARRGRAATCSQGCSRAGRSRRCQSITSPTACTCRRGIRRGPMRCGRAPPARSDGAATCRP